MITGRPRTGICRKYSSHPQLWDSRISSPHFTQIAHSLALSTAMTIPRSLCSVFRIGTSGKSKGISIIVGGTLFLQDGVSETELYNDSSLAQRPQDEKRSYANS